MFEPLLKMSILALECQCVIALRMMRLAQGGAAASAEVHRMWTEKAEAAVRFGPKFLVGGSIDGLVSDYRTVVRSNRSRLSGARRRRP